MGAWLWVGFGCLALGHLWANKVKESCSGLGLTCTDSLKNPFSSEKAQKRKRQHQNKHRLVIVEPKRGTKREWEGEGDIRLRITDAI